MDGRRTYWKHQRGAIDLMQLAVAFLMITVAVVGTTYAMFYGRQAIIRQEHRKVALYQLRQHVEQWLTRVAISDISPEEMMGGSNAAVIADLDDISVPVNTRVQATIVRGRTVPVDLPETGAGVDYYRISFSMTWQERDGGEQRIDIRTSMVRTD